MQEALSWFDNPPKRRRKLFGAAAAAHVKKMRRGKRKSSKGVRKMARKRRKLYGAAAKAHARARGRGRTRRSSHRKTSRRRRTHAITPFAVASRAGRKLRYRRRNPPFSAKGILGMLMDGAKDAAWVVGGKAGTRIIAGFIPVAKEGAVGLAVQVGSALALAFASRKFLGPNAAKMMLAGGLSAPLETFVKNLGIPYISINLGDGEGYYAVGAYPVPAISAYPMGAYPMGGDGVTDEAAYQ